MTDACLRQLEAHIEAVERIVAANKSNARAKPADLRVVRSDASYGGVLAQRNVQEEIMRVLKERGFTGSILGGNCSWSLTVWKK